MCEKRRFLRSAAFAVLALLPLPALGQGAIGPLEQVNTFWISPNSSVTASVQTDALAFIYAGDPYETKTLWRSDGTPAGTFMIGPRDPGPPQAPLYFAGSLGDLAFFTWAVDAEGRTLWRSDGSDDGTFPITEGMSFGIESGLGNAPESLAVPERGLVFFSAGEQESPDFELWATDGTTAGTRLVEDVNPEGASNPGSMAALGGWLYFLADTPSGRELWRSDGTPEGTERVAPFHDLGATIRPLVQAGGALFLVADSEDGVEVWRSDGTEGGTSRVLDLSAQRLEGFTAAGRRLFAVTRDASSRNRQIWAIHAAGEAVRVLRVAASAEIRLRAIGDNVAFSLEDDHGREPWWSDGTPQGTRRAADICPGPCSSDAFVAGSYGGRAVLTANDGTSGREPWLTDGTAAGTFRLGDFCPGGCDTFQIETREHKGWLWLHVNEVLWVSDGSRNGVRRIGPLPGNIHAWFFLPDRVLMAAQEAYLGAITALWSLPISAPPPPSGGGWITSEALPGFRVKARITAGGAAQPVRKEPCIAQTLCLSGAVPGRPELFVRVVGPKPNGYLWPTLVRFTTSTVEVWIEQLATGALRYYQLEGVTPDSSELNGLVDREGFQP
jgi:ELWxxDGT repeat protein